MKMTTERLKSLQAEEYKQQANLLYLNKYQKSTNHQQMYCHRKFKQMACAILEQAVLSFLSIRSCLEQVKSSQYVRMDVIGR